MQIQHKDQIQPNFVYGQVRYNINSSNWRQCKNITGSLQIANTNNQYIFFSNQNKKIVNHKNIYTFGKSSINQNKGTLYSINLVTQQMKQWILQQDSKTPQIRKNYGITNLDNHICIFGGQHNNNYFNDIHIFSPYINIWKPILDKSNQIFPKKRIPIIFTQYKKGQLILIGGYDNNGLIIDAYIMKNMMWNQLQYQQQLSQKYLNKILNTKNFSYCQGNNNCLYVFGGQYQNQVNNQFYKIIVNNNNKLKIIKIQNQLGPRPCKRINHNIQKLGQTSLIVYGGNNNQKKYRDVSIYDFLHNRWFQVYPLNGPLPLLYDNQILFQFNSIYIFGKFKVKDFQNNNDIQRNYLLQLNFTQYQIIKSQICSNCIKKVQIKQKQQSINLNKKIFISNGLLYNMAQQIKFPFQAFSLILDYAQNLQSQCVQIKINKTIDQLSYIRIDFDGSQIQKTQFNLLCSNIPPSAQSDILKLGCFRLGKTFLYININNNHRRVLLLSVDNIISSHYQSQYCYFAYQQRIVDNWIDSQQDLLHYKHINNLLRSYFKNPQQIINSVKKHTILILDNNIIMTNQNKIFNQLQPIQNDIIYYKNKNKAQFLNQLGYKLIQDPQLSLMNYLLYSRLNNQLKKLKIQNQIKQFKAFNYQQQLIQLQKSGKIIKYQNNNLDNLQNVQINLYQLNDQQYIKQIKGILIYYNNRLINRLDIPFGDLFWRKFYNNKYKKSNYIFDKIGIIKFNSNFKTNLIKNNMFSTLQYDKLIKIINRQFIKNNRQIYLDLDQPKKRKISLKNI